MNRLVGIQFILLVFLSLSHPTMARVGSLRLVRDIASEKIPIRMENLHLSGDQLLFRSRNSVWAVDLNDETLSQLGFNEEITGLAAYSREDINFFEQDDGLTYFLLNLETTAREWWRTDGTSMGTYALPELGEGREGSVYHERIRNTGDALEFYGKSGNLYGWWRLENGEHSLVHDKADFVTSGYIQDIVPANQGVYFMFETPYGNPQYLHPIYYLPDSGGPPVLIDSGWEWNKQMSTWGNRLILFFRDDNEIVLQLKDETSSTEIFRWEDYDSPPHPSNSLIVDDPDLMFYGGQHLFISEGINPVLHLLTYGWENSHGRDETLKPLFFMEDHVYFISYGEDPTKLWRLPITGGEKEFIAELGDKQRNGSGIEGELIRYEDRWYFFVQEEGKTTQTVFTVNLWESDGTPSGTRKLTTFYNSVGPIITWKNKLILSTAQGTGTVLRVYDLENHSSRELEFLQNSSETHDGVGGILGTHDGYCIFHAMPNGEGPRELWTSDGSSHATCPFTPLVQNPKSLHTTSSALFVYANDAIYWGDPGNRKLWSIDPRNATAERVSLDFLNDESITIKQILPCGPYLYFLLYTPAGYDLRRIHDQSLVQESVPLSDPMEYTYLETVGDNLILKQGSHHPSYYRLEPQLNIWQFLFASDSGLLVPVPGRGIATSSRTNPLELYALAYDAMGVSDGTLKNSRVLFDAIPNGEFRILVKEAGLNLVYFVASEVLPGQNGESCQLWAAPLAGGNPWKIMDLSTKNNEPAFMDIAVLGDICYFRADDGIHGYEPWITDGSPEGTHILMDVNPGAGNSMWVTFPCYDCVLPHTKLIIHEEKVYFGAFPDGEFAQWDQNAYELWVTDGTESGTRPVHIGNEEESIIGFASSSSFGNILVLVNSQGGVWIKETNWRFIPFDSLDPDGIPGGSFSIKLYSGDGLFYFRPTHSPFGRELFAIDLDSARGFFSDAARAADGWLWHAVYGWIFGSSYPWIWLQDAGTWLYCTGDGLPDASLYHPQHGWLYSPEEVYPWVYRITDSDWIRLGG